jgi:hypothetical protein
VSVLVTFTIGVAIWITGFAFGVKSFDAFMITILLVVGAITVRAARPLVDMLLNRSPAPPGE